MSVLSGKEVRKFFLEETWKEGRIYWQGGLVKDLVHAEGSWQGTVLDLSGAYRVRVRLTGQSLTIDCSCPAAGEPCRHAAALLWGWLVAPGTFLPAHRLRTKIDVLSRAEAVALLQQVVEEEGALLDRLLQGREKVSPQLTGAGLLALVYNLGFNPGSPWVNWRLFAERYRAALEMIAAQIPGREAEARVALNTLLHQLCGLLVQVPELRSLLLPLFWETFNQCVFPFRTRLDPAILEEILAVYHQIPLTAAEEKQFGELLSRLLANGLVEAGSLHALLSPGKEGDIDLKKLRLYGLFLLCSGKEDEFAKLFTACNQELAPCLVLIDLLEEETKYEQAKALLKKNLLKFTTPADRYVLRYRLAQLYRKTGELRPALFLEMLNFTARPGKKEYLQLKELAVTVGEWEAVKKRLMGLKTGDEKDILN